MAIAKASINAAANVFTWKLLKKKSANLIMIAVTNNLTTKVSRNKETRLSGRRNRKPIVALRIPINKATEIAVLKSLITTDGSTRDTSKMIPALRSSERMKYIVLDYDDGPWTIDHSIAYNITLLLEFLVIFI